MSDIVQKPNYLMNFYQNKDENKYLNFFKGGDDERINACNAKVKTAVAALEAAKAELEVEFANKYARHYEQLNQTNAFKYTARNRAVYYYDISGILLQLDNDDTVQYTIRELDTKHGTIRMLDGYCYDLASFVIKTYNYSISGNNDKCTFTLQGETLIPFFEDSCYTRAGRWGAYRYEMSGILRSYNATEFLDKFYNIDRHFDQNLDQMKNYQQNNPAFEVIIKTAPDSLLQKLLEMRDVEKSQPVYKLLGLTPEIYNIILNKGIEVQYCALRAFVNDKEKFHKTEMEWIEMIEEMKQREQDLEFFHIEYSGYYYRGDYPECQLLGYLADQYSRTQVLNTNYSFGKFCDYVIEETINQGFTELRLFVNELIDYLKMCKDQNIVPTLYSSYLSQTHDIAARNHKVYLDTMQEEIFKKRYEGYKTVTVGKDEDQYQIIAPTKSDDVKHEGDALNHCVASYIKRILDGQTQIFFLRKDPLVSLITLEVKEGRICQARGMHNRKPDDKENLAIAEFAKKKELKLGY